MLLLLSFARPPAFFRAQGVLIKTLWKTKMNHFAFADECSAEGIL